MPSTAYTPPELKRFFAKLPQAFDAFPAELELADREFCHYLATVVRAKSSERIALVDDARMVAYEALIGSLNKQTVQFSLLSRLQTPVQPLPQVTLAVALIKEQRWDWLVQKATELGVRAIQPLMTERTIVRLSAGDVVKKQVRWQAVARSAAEQSEGLFIPQIHPPMTVADYCQAYSQGDFAMRKRILLLERKDDRAPLKTLVAELGADEPITFAFGPEGGWTDAELASFSAAGFVSASLGERILRTETAAMAVMSAIVYESASWQNI